MLTLRDLTVSYGARPVIDRLTLELSQGAIHGLVGLNGSGKTTLFHTLYGLKKPDSGSITLDGGPLSPRRTALLETESYFYPAITGSEYLALFRAPGAFALELFRELFRLPLEEMISHYSTGMKKKLALTGVLKLDKDILLLDEPFNGVDMETGRIIGMVLRRLRERGKTIVVTSHVLETLTGISDEIHLLEGGSVRRSYSPQEGSALEQDLFSALEDRLRDRIDKAL
jgi:ABC-2 type transport system ATP-binding protein